MTQPSHPVIAIDGTAASGKSTFAQQLARRLGYTYVNTGAMYRGITWYLQLKNIALDDPAAISREIDSVPVETRLEKGELVFLIAGLDPLPHVRDAAVNAGVPHVAKVDAVRQRLVAEQQRLNALAPLVMEGRDIGTVVFPGTPYKFYLDANAEVRARRRGAQGETDAIQQRDAIDSQRKNSPLTCAPDAFPLDSSHDSVEELVAKAIAYLAERGLGRAQPVVPLWDSPAPHSLGAVLNDIPTLTVFLPKNATNATPAIVICPGGGYGGLAFDHEGLNVAGFFRDRGVAAFVLKYRIPVHGYRHPVPLLDAQRAIRLVRSHAADWNIDPRKVGVMGFSAGGHLCTTLQTHFDAGDPKAADPVDRLSCRPDFAAPIYAVVSLKDGVTHQGSKANLLGPNPDPALVENLSNETQVTPQTPPTVLAHSIDDGAVPIANSRLIHAALQKAGVPSVLHEYPTGGHGFGYGNIPDQSPAGWLENVHAWLKDQGLL